MIFWTYHFIDRNNCIMLSSFESVVATLLDVTPINIRLKAILFPCVKLYLQYVLKLNLDFSLSVVLSWHSIFVYNMDICFVIYLYFLFRVLFLLITSELSCQRWLILSVDYIHQPNNTVEVSTDTALAYFEYKLSKSRVFQRYLDKIQCPHFPLGQQSCDLHISPQSTLQLFSFSRNLSVPNNSVILLKYNMT